MTIELELLNNIDAILTKAYEVKDLEVLKMYILSAQHKIDLLRPFIEKLE